MGTAATAGRTASACLRELRRLELIERSFEFLSRRSQLQEKLHFVVEVDEKGFVLVFTEYVLEKRAAGGALLIENAPLAHAGIHQQAERQRKIGFVNKIGDRLRMAILVQDKIILGQIGEEFSVLVADGGEQVHGLDVDGDGRALLTAQRGIRQREKSYGKEKPQLFRAA